MRTVMAHSATQNTQYALWGGKLSFATWACDAGKSSPSHPEHRGRRDGWSAVMLIKFNQFLGQGAIYINIRTSTISVTRCQDLLNSVSAGKYSRKSTGPFLPGSPGSVGPGTEDLRETVAAPQRTCVAHPDRDGTWAWSTDHTWPMDPPENHLVIDKQGTTLLRSTVPAAMLAPCLGPP